MDYVEGVKLILLGFLETKKEKPMKIKKLFALLLLVSVLLLLTSCEPTDVPEEEVGEGVVYEEKIMFLSNRTGDYYDIFLVDSGGGGLTNITNTADSVESWASWSPDGSEIVYLFNPMISPSDTFAWDMELIVMDQFGNNDQSLDNDAPMKLATWSPSGNKIVYLKGAPYPDLYGISRTPGGSWDPPQLLCPTFTELFNIRTRIVFYGEDYIVFDGMVPLSIYRLSLDTCILEEFEQAHDDIQYEPEIADDGRVLFIRSVSPNVQSLYIKGSFDFGSVSILNNTDPFPHMPALSNDNNLISYYSNSSSAGPGPIKIYEISTGAITSMTSTTAVIGNEQGDFLQRWAPDDVMMVFSGKSGDPPGADIYVLDRSNNTIVNVSNGESSINVSPRWQPGEAPERPSKPDLVVVDDFTRDSTDGNAVEVVFTIRNIGDAASTDSRVYVNAINPDINEPTQGNQIQKQNSHSLSPLGPGDYTDFISVFLKSDITQLGIQYYHIIADPKNEVDEHIETNNESLLFNP